MPVATIQKILRPEHAVEYLAEFISDSDLGIKQILKYDQGLVDEYPAVQIFPADFAKEIHGTHTFQLGIRVDIYVMHADMTLSRMMRNYEDLALASELVDYLENDMTLGNRVIHGWIASETFAVRPPRTTKATGVVGTLLRWAALQQRRF